VTETTESHPRNRRRRVSLFTILDAGPLTGFAPLDIDKSAPAGATSRSPPWEASLDAPSVITTSGN
jgi:hypothetical protein